MSIPVVRFGDPTTTGGKVHAMHDDMCDDGKAIALSRERATCGNCEGTWPIVGTAYTMRNNGQPVVLHGDKVLCPCGRNRVISMSESCFYDRSPGEEEREANTGSPASAAPQSGQYDEQYVLKDCEGQPLANVRYRVVTGRGRLISGTTDARGQTARIVTDVRESLKLYIG